MTQEKKNIALLISLAIMLMAILGWFVFEPNQEEMADKSLFQVPDMEGIDRMVFAMPTDTVTLQYDGADWNVNGRYMADRNLVKVLFATLKQVEAKRPVAASLRDSLSERLRNEGVKVTLFSGNQETQSFFAGGNSKKTTAYFMKEGAPHHVAIPGYRVYVSGIFELDEKGWRDKYVFGFNWRNFQQLETVFPGQPQDGFSVSLDPQLGYFTVKGQSKTDSARLNTYLDQVSLLTVDRFANEGVLDSLKGLKANVEIKVTDIAQKQYTLQLYKGRGGDLGIVNGTDPVVFDPRKVRGLAHPRKYFLAP